MLSLHFLGAGLKCPLSPASTSQTSRRFASLICFQLSWVITNQIWGKLDFNGIFDFHCLIDLIASFYRNAKIFSQMRKGAHFSLFHNDKLNNSVVAWIPKLGRKERPTSFWIVIPHLHSSYSLMIHVPQHNPAIAFASSVCVDVDLSLYTGTIDGHLYPLLPGALSAQDILLCVCGW